MQNNNKHIAAMAAVAAVSTMQSIISSNTIAVTAILQQSSEGNVKKKTGRYLRSGAVPNRVESVWFKVDNYGDELEFLHFTSLSRHSFNVLCILTEPVLITLPLHRDSGTPRSQDLKRRMFSPRDMTAMALKFLLSRAEMKDLHVQFGAILSVFDNCTEVGMCAIVKVLMTDARSRVYWDRSEAGMLKASDLTKAVTGLPGAVVAMIDGKKLESLYPSDLSDQNRDYNGWTHDVFRNLVVVLDPEGKIVDVGVNLPGNFHDSSLLQTWS